MIDFCKLCWLLPSPFLFMILTQSITLCVACTVRCLRMSTVECLLFDMIICFGQFKFRKIYWSCQFLCGPCLFENPAVWNLNLLDTPVALPQAILLLLCLCSWCVDRVISWSVDNLHPSPQQLLPELRQCVCRTDRVLGEHHSYLGYRFIQFDPDCEGNRHITNEDLWIISFPQLTFLISFIISTISPSSCWPKNFLYFVFSFNAPPASCFFNLWCYITAVLEHTLTLQYHNSWCSSMHCYWCILCWYILCCQCWCYTHV